MVFFESDGGRSSIVKGAHKISGLPNRIIYYIVLFCVPLHYFRYGVLYCMTSSYHISIGHLIPYFLSFPASGSSGLTLIDTVCFLLLISFR